MSEHEGGAPQGAEIQEKTKAPEREIISNQRVALTARLLIGGDALNPQKTDINHLEVQHFPVEKLLESTGKVRSLSNNERKTYWDNQQETDFAKQKSLWSNQVKETFIKKVSSGSDAEKKSWTSVFKRLGIEGDITDEKMVTLYETYFSGDKKDSGIGTFVNNVIASYSVSENVYDAPAIASDLDKISWCANIFGENTSKIIPALFEGTLAKIDKKNLQELLTKVNTKENNIGRVNRLTDEE